ncbi:T9SS type A sorting domain-containing protein [Wenyingzhuangia sp. IMCC45533]
MKKIITFLLVSWLAISTQAQCLTGLPTYTGTLPTTNGVSQTFTASCDGQLDFLGIYPSVSSATTVPAGTLNIYSGSNTTGTPVYTQSYPSFTANNRTLAQIKITAGSSPVNLVNGQQYTFTLSSLNVFLFASSPTNYDVTINIVDNVFIPDTTLKNYLIRISGLDANRDGEVSKTEAQNFNGSINASNINFSDPTGLEAFINITDLNVNSNPNITSIDLSQNTKLLSLQIGNVTGLLNSLDLSNNTLLRTLVCSGNKLKNLDLSNLPDLLSVNCRINELENLNLANGNNSALRIVHVGSNSQLSCVKIDSGFTPPVNGWSKDATTSFSATCGTLSNQNITDDQQSVTVSYQNNQLSFSGLEKQQRVMIYDILGNVVFSKMVESDTMYTVENIPPGIFIVRLENKGASFKLLIQ